VETLGMMRFMVMFSAAAGNNLPETKGNNPIIPMISYKLTNTPQTSAAFHRFIPI
jgi:hypothetical protein